MKDNEGFKYGLFVDVGYIDAIEKHIHNWYSEITDKPQKYRYKCEATLSHIDVYKHPGDVEQEVAPHWHYITFGLSELKWGLSTESISSSEFKSGASFELTFRVKYSGTEEEPPQWPLFVLRALADYVNHTGNVISVGDHIPWNKPLDQISPELDSTPRPDEATSLVRHILVAEDPELMLAETGLSKIQFRQLLGVLGPEMKAAQSWKGSGVLALLSLTTQAGGSYFITDLSRDKSVFDYQPYFIQLIGSEITSEGSNLAHVTASCFWEGVCPADVPACSIRDSTGQTIEERSLESVTLYIDTEVSELLHVIARGRLAHDNYFVFESLQGAVIIFIPPGCTEPMVSVDWEHPLKAQGPALQIFCGHDFIEQFADAVKSFAVQYQDHNMSRDICLSYPQVTIIITDLSGSSQAMQGHSGNSNEQTHTPQSSRTPDNINIMPRMGVTNGVAQNDLCSCPSDVQLHLGHHGNSQEETDKNGVSAAGASETMTSGRQVYCDATQYQPSLGESLSNHLHLEKSLQVMSTSGGDAPVANNIQKNTSRHAKPPVPMRTSSMRNSVKSKEAQQKLTQQGPFTGASKQLAKPKIQQSTGVLSLETNLDRIRLVDVENPVLDQKSIHQQRNIKNSGYAPEKLVQKNGDLVPHNATSRSNEACIVERNSRHFLQKKMPGKRAEWSILPMSQEQQNTEAYVSGKEQSQANTGHKQSTSKLKNPFERFLQEKPVATTVKKSINSKDRCVESDGKSTQHHTNAVVPTSGENTGAGQPATSSIPDSYNTYSLPRSASKKHSLSDAFNWHSLPRSAGKKKEKGTSDLENKMLKHQPLSIDEKLISGFSDLQGVSMPAIDLLSTLPAPPKKSILGMIQGLQCFRSSSPDVTSVPYKSAFTSYSRSPDTSPEHYASNAKKKQHQVQEKTVKISHRKVDLEVMSPQKESDLQLNDTVLSLDWDDLPIPGPGRCVPPLDKNRPMGLDSLDSSSDYGYDEHRQNTECSTRKSSRLLDEAQAEFGMISGGSCDHEERVAVRHPDLSIVLEEIGSNDLNVSASSGSSTATECFDTSRSTTPIVNESAVSQIQTDRSMIYENSENTKCNPSAYVLAFDDIDQKVQLNDSTDIGLSPIINRDSTPCPDMSENRHGYPVCEDQSLKSAVSCTSIPGSCSSVHDSRSSSRSGSMLDISCSTSQTISIPTPVMRRRSGRRRSTSNRPDSVGSAVQLIAVSPECIMENMEHSFDLQSGLDERKSGASFNRDSMYILQSTEIDILEMVNSSVLPRRQSPPFGDDHLMNSTAKSSSEYDLSQLTDISMLPDSVLSDKYHSSKDRDSEMTMISLESISSNNSIESYDRLNSDSQLENNTNRSNDQSNTGNNIRRHSDVAYSVQNEEQNGLKLTKNSDETRLPAVSTNLRQSSVLPSQHKKGNILPTSRKNPRLGKGKSKKPVCIQKVEMTQAKEGEYSSLDSSQNKDYDQNLHTSMHRQSSYLSNSTDSNKLRAHSGKSESSKEFRSPRINTSLLFKSPIRGSMSGAMKDKKSKSGHVSAECNQSQVDGDPTVCNKTAASSSTGIPSMVKSNRMLKEEKKSTRYPIKGRGNSSTTDARHQRDGIVSGVNSVGNVPVSTQKHHLLKQSKSISKPQQHSLMSRQSPSTPMSLKSPQRANEYGMSSVSNFESNASRPSHNTPETHNSEHRQAHISRPSKPNQKLISNRSVTQEGVKTIKHETVGKIPRKLGIDRRKEQPQIPKKELVSDKSRVLSETNGRS